MEILTKVKWNVLHIYKYQHVWLYLQLSRYVHPLQNIHLDEHVRFKGYILIWELKGLKPEINIESLLENKFHKRKPLY